MNSDWFRFFIRKLHLANQSLVLKMAKIKSNEIVYDLYTGTGTIALFMSQIAKKVVGIESVQEAIDAAKQNALDNGF